MGTDINGWVEIRRHSHWDALVKIDPLFVWHDDMFGCLFGVLNNAGFRPIAALRGIPTDASRVVQYDDSQYYSHSHTWIMWNEIAAIDWDEPAENKRVYCYQRNEQGEWEEPPKIAGDYPPEIRVDSEMSIQIGDTLYKVKRITRRDALEHAWEFLFKMMAMLADRFGATNVRLTVWFDS